jgi:predicted metal-binding membrane protein
VPARTDRWFLPIAGMLTATAWLALCIWAWSPYGRYLDHGNWAQTGLGIALCRAVPAAGLFLPVLVYVAGWLLMTAAMMLPTVLPLLDRFDRLVSGRADRYRLIALLIGGYLAVWLGFGVAAHALDSGLHAAVLRSDWLLLNGWIVGSLILTVAGLFQFSRLKYRCLTRCRTPFSFIAKHWHGRRPLRDALLLGLNHGVFCVGCCWAIMLLMFVVGTGNIGWMLALSVVMTVEKNFRWGKRLSAPLGAALLATAAAVAAVNLA